MTETGFSQPAAYRQLLIAALLVVAPLVQAVPLWVLALFIALSAWRYLIDHHGWFHPGRITRLSLMLVTVALVLLHFGTVFGRDAGIALLLGLLGLL